MLNEICTATTDSRQRAHRCCAVLAAITLAACHTGAREHAPGERSAGSEGVRALLPVVDVEPALVATSGTPPLVVVMAPESTVDERGTVILAARESWSELASLDATHGKTVATLDVDKLLRATEDLQWTPQQIVENAGKEELPIASASEEPSYSGESNDPPPPPDEDAPAGSAADAVPSSARSARAAHVATAGGFGTCGVRAASNTGWGSSTITDFPTRLAQIVGEAVEDRRLSPHTPAIVFAAPHLSARALLLVLGMTRGAIGVVHDGHVSALRVQFATGPHEPKPFTSVPWIELRVVSPKKFELEAVPGKAIALAGLDQLGPSLAALRREHDLDAWRPVDILVGPDLDVQQLVNVIVAVDQAGAHAIGLGELPDAREMALRGHVLREFYLRSIAVEGDAYPAPIRRAVRDHEEAMSACYETALAKRPGLTGTVTVTLAIERDGHVVESSASGVDDALAHCIADTIKGRKYPTQGRGKVTIMVLVAPERRRP